LKFLDFTKIEAAGNDFIMVDNRQQAIAPQSYARLAQMLSPRRKGIGADGMIFIQDHPEYDFEMLYFNADGSGPIMCGNGARAAVLFVHLKESCRRDRMQFRAPDGAHKSLYQPDRIGITLNFDTRIREYASGGQSLYFLDTGAPHAVLFQSRLAQLDIAKNAPAIRKQYNANVNFIEPDNADHWHIRTYERGVEGETLACGTGATAAAVVLHEVKGTVFPITLEARGGRLQVDKVARQYWLWGPAKKVFDGRRQLTNLA